MVDSKKLKTYLTILLIFVLLFYLGASTGTFIALLTSSLTVKTVLYDLLQNFNYIGFGFNESTAFLIIPATILLVINIKRLDLDKRFIVSQILSFASFLIILLSLFIPFLLYLTWLADQPGVTMEIWGTVIPIFVMFLIELVLNLIVFVLLTIKRN